MKNVLICTAGQFAQSRSVQTTIGLAVLKLPEGTRLKILTNEQGRAQTREFPATKEIVLICRRNDGPQAWPSLAMLEKIEGIIIDENGMSVPEGKQLMVTEKRLALVDAE